MPQKKNIQYTLTPADPKGHLFHVEIVIPTPQTPEQIIRLPNWIPGSYLIRDFSKHIINLHATTESITTIDLTVIDKSTWSFQSQGHPVKIKYDVYAWDLSVRGAHFDESHAFFNGTSVFLAIEGFTAQSCELTLKETPFTKSQKWRVATGLTGSKLTKSGFGKYLAEDYDALIDHPFELGTFKQIDFTAAGIPHRMVFTGICDFDEERLKKDLIKICETELKLFGKPSPIESYLFQVMVTGSDYGGLEHRNSTALICSRNDLPYHGMTTPSDGYLQFLELCSHEYFHTWNVKRIQPHAYQTNDLSNPVYTNQLWWFEGVTSYYDALTLLRAKVIDEPTYLKLLAEQLTRVYRMPGRFKQSVANSSLMTWTKFYQQDENAPNSIISYYTKGSILALGLDLTIRSMTKGKKSLDTVLLHLWHHYGQTGKGLQEYEIESICSEVTGIDLTEFFDRYLYGTEDLPLKTLLFKVGVDFELRPAQSLSDTGGIRKSDEALTTYLGGNLQDTPQQTLQVTHVWQGSALYEAGISAGDQIIALNHLKVSSKAQVETSLKRSKVGDVWECHYFRRDELRIANITLQAPPSDWVSLTVKQSGKTLFGWL